MKPNLEVMSGRTIIVLLGAILFLYYWIFIGNVKEGSYAPRSHETHEKVSAAALKLPIISSSHSSFSSPSKEPLAEGANVVTDEEDQGTKAEENEGLLEGARVEVIDGTEIAWKKPEGKPVALLLLFHGCTHSGPEFFYLPEELIIVKEALKRNFVPLSFSSVDRDNSRCWDGDFPLDGNLDWKKVQKALEIFVKRESLTQLPLFGFGASSGGYFVSMLPTKLPLRSLVIQIASGQTEAIYAYDPKIVKKVFFSTMIKDQGTTKRTQDITTKLQKSGIEAEVLQVPARPLDPLYFSRYISGVSEEDSKKIFQNFESKGLITKDSKGLTFLSSDPRTNPTIFDTLGSYAMKHPDKYVEELNVLWATHELTSEHCSDWLDQMAHLTK